MSARYRPVPDVYEALIDSFVKNKGKSVDAAKAYIEELKEAERYVLEASVCLVGLPTQLATHTNSLSQVY